VILTRAVLSPRAAEPASLAGLFAGVPVTVTDSPAAALAALADRAAPLALVCGSLYLLGEVRPLLLGEAAGHRERWQ
jgi:dihydrofolate synthase / folylpolyglutamate synthase